MNELITLKFSMDSRHLRAINFFKWVIVAKLINQLINQIQKKLIKSINRVYQSNTKEIDQINQWNLLIDQIQKKFIKSINRIY